MKKEINKIKKIALNALNLIIVYSIFYSNIQCQTLSYDLSFDFDGKVSTNIINSSLWVNKSYAKDIATLSNNKIVVRGDANNNSGSILLAVYNTDGSLDSTFSNDGILITPFYSNGSKDLLGIQSDDKIIIVGQTTALGSTIQQPILIRYNNNGTIDSTFSSDGIDTVKIFGTSARPSSLAIQSDGKIILRADNAFLRYHTDGTHDNTLVNYTPPSLNGDFFGYVTYIQPDGKILVGGTFNPAPNGGNEHSALARYNTDGSFDNSFGSNGFVLNIFSGSSGGVGVNSYITCITLQNDGKILIGGAVQNSSGYDAKIFRLNSNGSIDINFSYLYGSNYYYDDKIVVGIVAHNNGRIYSICSDFYFDEHDTLGNYYGEYYRTFPASNASDIFIQTDGNILLAGNSPIPNANGNFYIERYSFTTLNLENSKSNPLTIYPNPANNEVFVKLESNDYYQVAIFDMMGRKLIQNSFLGSESQIDIETLNNGLYIVQVQSQNGATVSKKLEVNK